MNTLKNLAKKAVAIGSGMLAIGATIAGAAALDLKDYPAPFIQNGQFNGLIVVGEKAMPADILGAIEIAASLQASSTSASGSGSSSTTSMSGDVKKIGDSADMLEIGEFIGSVTETLTDDDLMFLKGGVISTNNGDTDFTQQIELGGSNVVPTGQSSRVVLDEDNAKNTGMYFYFKDRSPMFNYQLEFTSGLDSSVDADDHATDIEDESLYILGQYFSVVSATNPSSNSVKLDLIAGDVTDTLREGEVKTYTIDGKTYEVTLLAVSDNQNPVTAKFLVNGESTDSMTQGETDKVAGLDIGVRELLANEGTEANGADLAEFYLGANKLELKDTATTTSGSGGSVKVNGENIEDAHMDISTSIADGSDLTLSKISYTLDGDAMSGDSDLFLKKGEGIRQYLDEPAGMLADKWDIKYQGLSAPAKTDVSIAADGDDQYNLEFTNRRGTSYNIPLLYYNTGDSAAQWGDDTDALVFWEKNVGADAATAPTNATDYALRLDSYAVVTDMSGGVVDNGDDTYVLQFNDVDESTKTLTFQEVGSGTEVKGTYTGTLSTSALSPSTGDVTIGGKDFAFWIYAPTAGDYRLAMDLNNDGIYATSGSANAVETQIVVKGGGILSLTEDTNADMATEIDSDGVSMSLTTQSDDLDSATTDQVIEWTVDEIDSDDQLDITQGNLVGVSGSGHYFQTKKVRGEDRYMGVTEYGTMIDLTSDTNSANTLTLSYPAEQVEALVYVTGGEVQTSTATGGAGVIVNPIRVGTAKLDKDVRADQSNMIVVGGPCVNTIAAGLLGNPANCAEGFVEGTAMLKMFDTGNNVAVLVAGYGAQDTQGASRVLAQYHDNALMGESVTLAVTSVDRVTIRK